MHKIKPSMTNLPRDKTPKKKDKPLLTIELQDEMSVPKVIYKGKEITDKIRVNFEWETDTEYIGGLTYAMEYHENNSYPVTNMIERRVKGHSLD